MHQEHSISRGLGFFRARHFDRFTHFFLSLLLVATCFLSPARAQQQQPDVAAPAGNANLVIQQGPLKITEIPSPRHHGGWVTDLSGTLSDEAIDYINRVGDEVNQVAKRQMCVVVVKTTSGQNHRQYAAALFNHWGVGSAGFPGLPGVWSDNGVMLFIATEDRKAELILGDGIDDFEEVRVAQQIIDQIVVPKFQQGDPNSAIYQGFRACATRIFAIADLQAPALLPSVSGFDAKPRGPARKQRGPVTWWPWIAGTGLIGGIGLLIGGRYYMRYRPRTCEKCQLQMVLLEEHQDDAFLNSAEQLEEHLGSVDYDVWACLQCDDVLRIRYGTIFTRYSHCPSCGYVTVHRVEQTLVAANYSHGGKVRVIEDCQNCSYVNRYIYRTPKLVKPKSSSSSGGGGFGSGGRSSGFGGGSTSGRGASGSW